MVNNRIKLLAALALLCAGAVFFSCQAPSPLYGTWGAGGSNGGQTLTLVPDGTFTSKINGTDYEGTYEVNLNIISFSMSNGTVVSEWDIRANVLYLTWTTEANQTYNLTMYKIKN